MANQIIMNTGLIGVKELKIGKTFTKGCKDESYHTIRYDFKPASVDAQKVGTLEVVDKEVTLSVPTEGGGLSQAAVFKGNKTPASKECLLIIDNETGEVVLERISQHIRVKKTRAEGSSKKIISRALPQSDSRPLKASPSQNQPTNSPHVPRPSPSHRSPPSKSPVHRNGASNKIQNNSSSMPMLSFEEDNKAPHNSIMSDSSSDSDSNSGSSSSSDSDSDSEPDVPPQPNSAPNGTIGATTKNHKSPSSILSDLELSEED